MRGNRATLALVIILFFGLMGLAACSGSGGSDPVLEADVTGNPTPVTDDATEGGTNSPTETDPNQNANNPPGDSGTSDSDGDGIVDAEDNCPNAPNPSQQDSDGNGVGDACEVDSDSDGVVDVDDNCPNAPNPSQQDSDGNGVGDACEVDSDSDGIVDVDDNCPNAPNPSQQDSDGNGVGDACEIDTDGDGVIDFSDNCPADSNVDQADGDGDGLGDVCDNCPFDNNADQADRDLDTIGDICDLSPLPDSLTWIGNTPMKLPASAILANDPVATVVDGGDDSSAQGGTVVFEADGSFTYTPADGFIGQDSFSYTAVNGNHVESAVVTVQIDTLAWYVDNRAAEDLSGSFNRPFDSLTDAEAASQPGETIFVFAGDTMAGLDSGISLKADQRLLGEGIAFAYNGIEIVPAGSKPVLLSAVVLDDSPVVRLADGNEVAGLSFEEVVNAAVLGQNLHGVHIHDNSFIDSNGAAIRLVNLSGSAVVALNTITGGNHHGIEVTNIGPNNGAAADVSSTLRMTGNSFEGTGLSGISLVLGGESTVVNMVATDNLIKGAGANAIRVALEGNAALGLMVEDNIITQSVLEGIGLQSLDTATLTARIEDNKLELNGGLADFLAINNEDASICLELIDNTSGDPIFNPAGCLVDNKGSQVGSFSFYETGNDLPALRVGDITDVDQGACAQP